MTSLTLAVLLQAPILANGGESYAKAYDVASKTGRPMVVFVGAEWCGPCRAMKEDVIPQVRRRGLFREVAFASVNLDRQRELGRKLTRGGPIPQLLLFRRTRRGWRLSRLTGGQSVGEVAAFVDHGLKRDRATKAKDSVATEHASNAASDAGRTESG